MEFIRASFKTFIFTCWVLVMVMLGIFTFKTSKKLHQKFLKTFFGGALKILGISVTEENKPKDDNISKLYISNHCSYLDIFLTGATMKLRFTPKTEIAKWPVIGWLVNMSYPFYIARNPRKSLEQKEQLQEIINHGDNILLFPESSTNDGRGLLPFKSSLFSVAEISESSESHIKIAPLSIIYSKINGKKIDEKSIDKIAWYGDMEFIPHFWELMKSKSAEAKIIHHDLLDIKNFNNRKDLSNHCKKVIEKGLRG